MFNHTGLLNRPNHKKINEKVNIPPLFLSPTNRGVPSLSNITSPNTLGNQNSFISLIHHQHNHTARTPAT